MDMIHEVLINYKGNHAVYQVRIEDGTIFQAELVGQEQPHGLPRELLLFKGIHRWVGSAEDAELLNLLGQQIEGLYTHLDLRKNDQLPFYSESLRQRGDGPPEAFQLGN